MVDIHIFIDGASSLHQFLCCCYCLKFVLEITLNDWTGLVFVELLAFSYCNKRRMALAIKVGPFRGTGALPINSYL